MTTMLGETKLELEALDCVEAVDLHHQPGDETKELEIVQWGGDIDTRVLALLADAGLAINPDATATRGTPTHTTIVAHG